MPDLIGQRLAGKYEVQDLIGQGGMGVVYRGYDTMLQRTVAIKVLPPQLTWDAAFVKRFQQEAVAAANLHHAHIVTIHDVGAQDGAYYIVMEHLEGVNLEQWLAQYGPMSPSQASHVLQQVASALDYAHDRGLIHRDIKPSNIMLAPDGRATLMDFGLVRAGEGAGLTRSSMVMGTPEYIAPEQALGQAVDRRTDIYALGVVLYRLLAGAPPFAHSTPMATIHAHAYEPPPPLRQKRPGLPLAVEAVVLKALKKRPEERYQQAGHLAREFELAAAGKAPASMKATPAPKAEVAAEWPMATPPPGKTRLMSPGQGMSAAAGPPLASRGRGSLSAPLLAGIAALLAIVVGGAAWALTRNGDGGASPTAIAADSLPSTATLKPLVVVAASDTPTGAPATATDMVASSITATSTRAAELEGPATATKLPTATLAPAATSMPTARPTATATVTSAPPTPALAHATNTPVRPTSTSVPSTPTPAPEKLAAPDLQGPEDGWGEPQDTVTLTWSPVTGAASYRIETRSDRPGQQEWRPWTVGDATQLTIRYDGHPDYFHTPGTVYTWRVLALNANGLAGDPSPERRFVFQRASTAPPPTDTPAPPPTDTPAPPVSGTAMQQSVPLTSTAASTVGALCAIGLAGLVLLGSWPDGRESN